MRVEIYGDANRETVSGPTVQFTADDAAPVTDLKAQITPSIAGHSSVTITANGQNTSVSLTKPVYGGAVDVTTGVVTETHGGGAYNPTEVPTDLSSKIVSATTERSASGSVASFNCTLGEYPMSALTAAINPVQDLHGYDRPWPGGGGTNLFQSALCANVGSATNNGITFTYHAASESFTVAGTATGTAINAYLFGSYGNANPVFTLPAGTYTFSVTSGTGVVFYSYDGTTRRTYNCTPSGDTYTFDSDTPITAMKPINKSSGQSYDEDFRIQIEKGSAKTSWEPYENLCPITGWTVAKVTRTGKNLLQNTGVSKTENGITWTVNSDGSISARGTASGNSLFVVNQFTFDGQSYILTGCPEGGASNTKWQIQVLENLSGGAIAADTGSGVTITRTGNLYIRCVVRSGNTVDFTFKPMIRLSSESDATFSPYSGGTTYDITFPTAAGTVYGGTLDVVNGVLTVTWKKIALGDYAFGKSADNNFYISTVTDFKTYGDSVTRYGQGISDTFKFLTNNWNAANNTCTCYLNTGYNGYRIFIHSEEHSSDTVSAFRAWLQSVNAGFAYELATPITYQLTPQDIATILGQNNVWADCGPVTVSYRDGLLSNVSGIMTNSTALTAGENITYTLSQEQTFQIPGTVIRTVVGNNVMSASTGNISVTWSSHWFDITPWIAYQGLTFSRNDVDSPDAGRDMSGYMHRGRVGVKEKMNVTTVQLTRAQSSTLQTLLYPETIQVRVTPYPRTNTSHTMSMYTNNVKTTYVIHRENGEDLQSLTFPLIEN